MLLLNILEQIQYANVTIQLNLPYVIYIYIYIYSKQHLYYKILEINYSSDHEMNGK